MTKSHLKCHPVDKPSRDDAIHLWTEICTHRINLPERMPVTHGPAICTHWINPPERMSFTYGPVKILHNRWSSYSR